MRGHSGLQAKVSGDIPVIHHGFLFYSKKSAHHAQHYDPVNLPTAQELEGSGVPADERVGKGSSHSRASE